jgi:hypothetical protein
MASRAIGATLAAHRPGVKHATNDQRSLTNNRPTRGNFTGPYEGRL